MEKTEYVLETEGLVKKYKGVSVLRGVSLCVRRGDVYGFVGENGSGKTTVIRLVTGLILPDGGSYRLFGTEYTAPAIGTARRRVGAIVEAPSLYLNMTARENLEQMSLLLGGVKKDKFAEVLLRVGLSDLLASPKKAGNFSLGMRQRLGIAMALLGDPELLFLDEPLNGLDPHGIVEVRELIQKLRGEGITFFISSHILSELALIANRYGIISKGRILQEISAEDLKKQAKRSVTLSAKDRDGLYALLAERYAAEDLTLLPDGVCVWGEEDLSGLLSAVLEGGIALSAVNTREGGIEDYYLSLIGGGKNA